MERCFMMAFLGGCIAFVAGVLVFLGYLIWTDFPDSRPFIVGTVCLAMFGTTAGLLLSILVDPEESTSDEKGE